MKLKRREGEKIPERQEIKWNWELGKKELDCRRKSRDQPVFIHKEGSRILQCDVSMGSY